MPTYGDIGEDWERDWIAFAMPQVPPFLAFCSALLLAVLGVSVFVAFRRRQYKLIPGVGQTAADGDVTQDKAPGWL